MSALYRGVRSLFQIAISLAFVVMIGAVLLQIYGRLVGNSFVWTEELTRYALLFLAAFGVGLSYQSGDLVNVDLFCERLPGRWPVRLRFLAAGVTCIFSGMLVLPAWKYTQIGARQHSAALEWRMDFIHASVLILLVSLCAFSLLRVLRMLTGKSDGKPVPHHQP